MSTKTIVYILIGIAIAYAIGYVYLKGFQANSEATSDAPSTLPTVEDIMTKGYDADEAKQILASLEAGRSVNY